MTPAQLFKKLSALQRSGLVKKTPAKKATHKRKGRSSRSSSGGAIRATLLGKPLKLEYIHAGDNSRRVHTFPKGARISYTDDSRHLVIDGISVRAFIDHP